MSFGAQKKIIRRIAGIALILSTGFFFAPARAFDPTRTLLQVEQLYQNGKYIDAARTAFLLTQLQAPPVIEAQARSWIFVSLNQAGLKQSSLYFFIKAIESKNSTAIQRVLLQSQSLGEAIGIDSLRSLLNRETRLVDYSATNRGIFLIGATKEALLKGRLDDAETYARQITEGDSHFAEGLFFSGVVATLKHNLGNALAAFKRCQIITESRPTASDLYARCVANEARTLYEAGKHDAADLAYHRVPQNAFIWPSTLLESAWNYFSRKKNINSAIGKLVAFKSPAFSEQFFPEADILRSQLYLNYCYSKEAGQEINEFKRRYERLGAELRPFLEQRANDPEYFYARAIWARRAKGFKTLTLADRLIRAYSRSPSFEQLIGQEEQIEQEMLALPGLAKISQAPSANQGLFGFLGQVLQTRKKSLREQGGSLLIDQLVDFYSGLITQIENAGALKLLSLDLRKERVIREQDENTEKDERTFMRGVRNDETLYFPFLGEFWRDELGDYVFHLKNKCS